MHIANKAVMSTVHKFLACALIAAAVPAAVAQKSVSVNDRTPPTSAQATRWPDFTTGSWAERNPFSGVPGAGPAPPAPSNGMDSAPLNAHYAAEIEAQKRLNGAGGSGSASCEPLGVVVDTGSTFYFTRDVILISGEMRSTGSVIFRRIYLNRTEHGDPEPTYFGDSIGHWQGRTLVIDTTAIRSEAQLMSGVAIDSNATHMIERYRLTGPDTLELVKTVENPEVFTKPWTSTTILHRTHGPDFVASYCWRDREANSATQGPDTTPPPN
jgi:hypothetical protein